MGPDERALLLRRGDPTAADVPALLQATDLPLDPVPAACVLTIPWILTPEQCATLRRHAARTVRSDLLDTIDGGPEFQVDVNCRQLTRWLGEEAVSRLWTLPSQLMAQLMAAGLSAGFPAAAHGGGPATAWRLKHGFLRLYGSGTRPHLMFHEDVHPVSVNVALSDPSDHDGGELLAVVEGAVRVVARSEGDATVHVGAVPHAVTAVTQGQRCSLILFFHIPTS